MLAAYSIASMPPFPPNALLLAPMVGITNRAFRRLVFELGGAGWYFTEMASAEAFSSHALYEDIYTDPSPEPERTSVQFYARSPEALARACEMLRGRPAGQLPAGVDINFGCSAPHIRRAGGGSKWSGDPAKSAELVAAARSAWPRALSAKLRLGPDDDYGRFLSYCAALAEAGLDFITVHPRTDSQKFRRAPLWDHVGALARDLDIPVVANGDISDGESLSRVMEEQKPYAAMIGREAVRRPWIFGLRGGRRAARAEGADGHTTLAEAAGGIDRLATGLRFIDLAEELLPPPWRLESSRRFFSYYCDRLTFAHHIKYSMLNAASLDAMRDIFRGYFAQVPGDRVLARDG